MLQIPWNNGSVVPVNPKNDTELGDPGRYTMDPLNYNKQLTVYLKNI
jgi:hypothetical protein